MFCLKCRSHVWKDNGSKYCATCAPKANDLVICDIWAGTTKSVHVARYLETIEEALARTRAEVGRDHMITIINAGHQPHGLGSFDKRLGIDPQHQPKMVPFKQTAQENVA